MFLLRRIAISKGDKARQTAAYEALAVIDQPKVANWNRLLEAEIRQKRATRYPIGVSSILIQGGKA